MKSYIKRLRVDFAYSTRIVVKILFKPFLKIVIADLIYQLSGNTGVDEMIFFGE